MLYFSFTHFCKILGISQFTRFFTPARPEDFHPCTPCPALQEKSSVRLGCRVHSLALGPFSMCLTVCHSAVSCLYTVNTDCPGPWDCSEHSTGESRAKGLQHRVFPGGRHWDWDTETLRHWDTETLRHWDPETETLRHWDWDTETETQRLRHSDWDTETETLRQRHWDWDTETESRRLRHWDWDTETETETLRLRHWDWDTPCSFLSYRLTAQFSPWWASRSFFKPLFVCP